MFERNNKDQNIYNFSLYDNKIKDKVMHSMIVQWNKQFKTQQ